MTFTPYTPDPTAWSDTIEEPDDAQFQTDGMAAFNTPIEQLADNIAYLGQAGTFARDVGFDVTTGTAAILNVSSSTSVTWQDITGVSEVVAVKPGDRLCVDISCDTDLGNAGTHYIRACRASGSAAEDDVGATARLLEGTERKGHTLMGVWQATHDENVTIKLQGKAETGDFSVYQPAVVRVIVIAKRTAWP